MQPLGSLGIACMTFASQNMGGKKYERIREAVLKCILVSCIYSIIIAILNYTLSEQMIAVFSGNGVDSEESIKWASRYMRFNTSFYMVLGALFILRQALPSFGHKTISLVASVIEMSFKIFITLFLIDIMKYWAVIMIEPIIWTACVISMLFIFFKDKQISKSKKPKIIVNN